MTLALTKGNENWSIDEPCILTVKKSRDLTKKKSVKLHQIYGAQIVLTDRKLKPCLPSLKFPLHMNSDPKRRINLHAVDAKRTPHQDSNCKNVVRRLVELLKNS